MLFLPFPTLRQSSASLGATVSRPDRPTDPPRGPERPYAEASAPVMGTLNDMRCARSDAKADELALRALLEGPSEDVAAAGSDVVGERAPTRAERQVRSTLQASCNSWRVHLCIILVLGFFKALAVPRASLRCCSNALLSRLVHPRLSCIPCMTPPCPTPISRRAVFLRAVGRAAHLMWRTAVAVSELPLRVVVSASRAGKALVAQTRTKLNAKLRAAHEPPKTPPHNAAQQCLEWLPLA